MILQVGKHLIGYSEGAMQEFKDNVIGTPFKTTEGINVGTVVGCRRDNEFLFILDVETHKGIEGIK